MKFLVLSMALALCPVAASAEDAPAAPTVPRPVVSEIVVAGPVRAQTFPGVIAGENTAMLGFLTGGRIATIEVTEGETVAQGARLATLDQVTLSQDLAAARAARAAAQAEADLAAQQYARVKALRERGVATQAQLDAARANRDATAAQAETAQASLARAEDAAGYATLTAPRSGIVLSIMAEPGETVTSGEGVIELADLDGRAALIDVPEDFAELLPEDAVFALRRHGQTDDPIPSALSLIEPTTDTSLGTRRLRLTVEAPPEDFRIGSLVEASYVPRSAPVTTVPQVAIIEGDTGPEVWRVEGADRHVMRVPVTLGAEIGDRVIVTGGIALGDEIITRGVHSLTEGQIVGARLQ